MKFKYDYRNNRLGKLDGEYTYEIPEESQFITQFGGSCFILDPNNHGITFTVKKDYITVFYKQVSSNKTITYYKTDLIRLGVIAFKFSEKDQVEKINGIGKPKKK